MARESKTARGTVSGTAPGTSPSGKASGDTALRRGQTRAIGALLPGIAGETLGRRGFAEGTLFQQWREIVGADIAADCLPEKLAYPAGRRSGGTLHVLAAGGAALELQHRASQIVDRVNSYLGYGALAQLRIRQGRMPARKRYDPVDSPAGDEETFENTALQRIADPKLKEALASFGHAVRRSEKRRKTATRTR